MWPIFQAIILGIVEGLTEFLPISSTGHLIVAEHVIGYKDTAKLFTVVIQVGAIAAVIWFYRKDLWRRIKGFFKNNKKDQKFWLNLGVAIIPAGLMGVLLDNSIERWATPLTVAIALIAGGFVLLWAENRFEADHAKKTDSLDNVTIKQALLVGVAQVFSLIPGVSRSGATIVGGMLSGFNRVTATAFSFWLSIPIIVLASGYKLAKDREAIASLPGGSPAIIVGVIVSFISALLVVKWLLRYVAKHNFRPFAYYRFALGGLILLMLAFGFISNNQ